MAWCYSKYKLDERRKGLAQVPSEITVIKLRPTAFKKSGAEALGKFNNKPIWK